MITISKIRDFLLCVIFSIIIYVIIKNMFKYEARFEADLKIFNNYVVVNKIERVRPAAMFPNVVHLHGLDKSNILDEISIVVSDAIFYKLDISDTINIK